MTSEVSADVYANWADLVGRVRRGDRTGAEALYHAVTGNARAKLRRTVDPHLVEDRLHDTYVSVLEAIQGGALREPERLLGFVRTVTQRQVAAQIRANMAGRRRLTQIGLTEFPSPREFSPDAALLKQERDESLGRLLRRLRARDREILVRFYWKEEPPEQICDEMKLTHTQFRLFKSRALARCSEFVHRGRTVQRRAVEIATTPIPLPAPNPLPVATLTERRVA